MTPVFLLLIGVTDAVRQPEPEFQGTPGLGYSNEAGAQSGGGGAILMKATFASFRGGGYIPKSMRRTVVSADISESLFSGPRDPSDMSFIVPYSQYFNYNSSILELSDINVIAHPEMPFAVNNVTYFWSQKYLIERDNVPKEQLRSSGENGMMCTVFNGTLAALNGTSRAAWDYCFVPRMERCYRKLVNANQSILETLQFPDGSKALELNWMCPVDSTTCCEWECCESVFDSSTLVLYGIGGVLIFIPCMACCLCCGVPSCCKKAYRVRKFKPPIDSENDIPPTDPRYVRHDKKCDWTPESEVGRRSKNRRIQIATGLRSPDRPEELDSTAKKYVAC